SVFDGCGFFETVPEPGNICQERTGWMGKAQMEMNLHHIPTMRHNRQMVRMCQLRYAPPLGDSRQAHGVRLYECHRTCVNELPEVVQQVKLLAECDRRFDAVR